MVVDSLVAGMLIYFFLGSSIQLFWCEEILVFVSLVGHSSLHCSSRNLLESLQNVTPFCVIIGSKFLSYIEKFEVTYIGQFPL